MSKGSPIIPVRIPADLLDEIDARVARSVLFHKVPLTRSAFIILAMREKLDHYKRSCRKGCNTPKGGEHV